MLNTFLYTEAYPEVVCLQEIWVSQDEAKSIKIDKYKVASYYTRQNARGGGVAILVRDDIKYEEKILHIDMTEKMFEAVSVNIFVNGIKINVNSLYRSPVVKNEHKSIFYESLEKLLLITNKYKGPKFVCADFNYNFLENTRATCDVVNLFSSYGLKQCFSDYSRIYGESMTLIDNVFANIDPGELKTETIANTLSDHNAQLVNFIVEGQKSCITKVNKRLFTDCNKKYFKHLLTGESWHDVYNEPKYELKFHVFFTIFLSIFNIAFPIRRVTLNKQNKNKPWITPEIVEEGKFLKDVYHCYKATNDPNIKTRYNILKKRHMKNITATKKSFYDKEILNADNKSRAVWSVINKNTNINKKTNSNLPKTLNIDCTSIQDRQEQSNTFNTFFLNSVDRLTSKGGNNLEGKTLNFANNNSIFLSPVSSTEIKGIILSASRKKSAGPDGIPCCLLKECADLLAAPLAYLVNISFEIGLFPEQLRTALIIPIHKKNDSTNIENYRPIALLSVFSKIFEKAFKSRLQSFFIRQKLLTPRQYGFTENRSTQDALLSFYEKILDNFNSKLKSVGIFFDLSRAFDTINYKLLLDKLQAYGIRGNAWSWLKSYLYGRTQSVCLTDDGNKYYSESIDVTRGVPQGSVLGPLLFIIFINDLPDYLRNAFLTLFADDTSAILTADNMATLSKEANNCVELMSSWCHTNGLVLNPSKTELMLFTPITVKQDSSLLVRINNVSTAQTKSIKFLGIHLDNCMSWETHIENLSSRLATKNFSIIQLRGSVNISTLKVYYYGCIQSILSYGIMCWGNCSGINKIFIQQKRLLRNMLNVPYSTSCRELFKQQGILTIYSLYILQCVCYVKKNLPQFVKCGDINHYSTRSANKLYVPPHRLSQVAKGPFILSIRIYNSLPDNIKSINSFKHFKQSVIEFLNIRCFYSLQEFFDCCENI